MSSKVPDDHVVDRLVAWLQAGGCDLSKRETRYLPGKGYTSFAAKRLRPSETIIYIPLSYLMTNVLAEQSDIGLAIAKANVQLQSNHSVLAAYMLQEKRNHFSFWKPYLDSLPTSFDNIPLFFEADILNELRGSMVIERVLNRRYALATEYRNLVSAVPAFKAFSWHEFMWARTAITTRCFGTTIDGRKAVAMVPLMDMANHSNDAKTHWGSHRTGMAITAKSSFSKGEELFISYGEKSTNRFFSSYGFINDDHSHDECSVTPHLSHRDTQYYDRLERLSGEHYREFALRATYNETFKECLTYLRFIVQETADEHRFNVVHLMADQEKKVLQLLQDCCQNALSCYDTSLDQDQILLAQSISDDNKRHCIEMRAREKQVLHHIIDFTRHALIIWQDPDSVVKQAAESSNSIVRDYFNDRLMEA